MLILKHLDEGWAVLEMLRKGSHLLSPALSLSLLVSELVREMEEKREIRHAPLFNELPV